MDTIDIQDNAFNVRSKANNAIEELGDLETIKLSDNAAMFRDKLNAAALKAGIEETLTGYEAAPDVRNFINSIIQAVESGVIPGPDNPDPDEPSTIPAKLNILVIGNSHSEDAWGYVPFILKKYGIDCLMVLALHRGEFLHNFVSKWNTTPSTHLEAGSISNLYYIDTSLPTGTAWQCKFHDYSTDILFCPNDAVTLTYDYIGGDSEERIPWDIVTIQAYRFGAGSDDNKSNVSQSAAAAYNLIDEELTNYVKGFTIDNQNQSISPAYCLDMAKAVISGENSKADLFFPIAPAIWKMRAQSSFRDLPTGYAPRNFYADYAHICEGLPCYTAASTIVESILKYYNHEGLKVDNDDLIPNSDFVRNNNIPWTNWKNNQVCGVSSNWDANKQAAITAAKDSVNEINKVLSGILDINSWTYAGNNNKFYVTVKAVGCDVYLGTIRSGAFNATYTINNGSSRTFECSMYSSSFDFYIAHSGSVTSTETSKLMFSDGSEVEYYPWNTQNSSIGTDIPQGGNHRIMYPVICYNVEYTVTCNE